MLKFMLKKTKKKIPNIVLATEYFLIQAVLRQRFSMSILQTGPMMLVFPAKISNLYFGVFFSVESSG